VSATNNLGKKFDFMIAVKRQRGVCMAGVEYSLLSSPPRVSAANVELQLSLCCLGSRQTFSSLPTDTHACLQTNYRWVPLTEMEGWLL
jgi:hypothetical protein